MNKIIVIGCPGSGKSTFSKKLHQITDIPLYHLDMMYWNSDKTIVNKDIFLERLLSTIKTDKWIIDGNYSSTMELRIQHCDTIIFLDYPVDICLNGISKRKGKERTDIPWIENDEDFEFIEFVKKFNVENRPSIIELFKKYSNKCIYIFKSRDEANAFLSKLLQA